MPEFDNKLRVAQLRIRDFKCLREVEIEPNGDLIRIIGATGQGKTAVLEAIEAALVGGDGTLVRRGADRAEIFISVGDLSIRRRIPAQGRQSLRVEKNGVVTSSVGNSILKALFGQHIFRPLKWVQAANGDSKGRKERLRRQRSELLAALPASLSMASVREKIETAFGTDTWSALADLVSDEDFSNHALEVCHKIQLACEEARKPLNRELVQAKADVDRVPVKVEPVAISMDAARQNAAEARRRFHMALGQVDAQKAVHSKVVELEAEILSEAAMQPSMESLVAQKTSLVEQMDAKADEIEALKAALARATKEFAALRKNLERVADSERAVKRLDERRCELERMRRTLSDTPTSEDVETLREQVGEAEAMVCARQDYERRLEATERESRLAAKVEHYTRLVGFFRDLMPREILDQMDLPLDGLGFEGDCVTIDGIPIHRLGTSEQIRLGVKIALLLNPTAGFVCIDGAESLGADGFRELKRISDDMGIQLWMTEVNESYSIEPRPDLCVISKGQLK